MHIPPVFVLAFSVSVGYPVMKGLIHIPLNQVQPLITEGVLRFGNVNGGDCEALPPGLCYHADDDTRSRWRRPDPGPHPQSGIPLAISGAGISCPLASR